ncbi:MAG TPA: hypothetical protein VE967_06045, partial [Gemmatimonadaceae bacterium]|nr:hypothetical protein [Gemmatimonadaceae bacterium]
QMVGMTATVNPVSTIDDWGVLSDGSIAFVRGHDYHVDLLRPDGSVKTGEKLPFDWKRLTDEDKQKLLDSAKAADDKAAADAKAAAAAGKGNAANDAATAAALSALAGAGGGGGLGGGGGGGGGGGEQRVVVMSVGGGGGGGPVSSSVVTSDGSGPRTMNFTPEIEYVPLKEIPDYYPPIRQGAARADMDGNLWILPTTSAQSKNGELVYDVVNKNGDIFERVRIPAGRSIVGFGKGGIVYLQSGSRANGFSLERTQLVNPVKGAQ